MSLSSFNFVAACWRKEEISEISTGKRVYPVYPEQENSF